MITIVRVTLFSRVFLVISFGKAQEVTLWNSTAFLASNGLVGRIPFRLT